MPGILKLWFDEVFTYQFAYGSKGDKMKGKNFLLSFTVGGPTDAYQPKGYNHFRIPDFLKPMEQTAYLAQMNYHDPIYTHQMTYIPGVYNVKEEVEQRAATHGERLVDFIKAQEQKAVQEKIENFAKTWFAQFDRLDSETLFYPYLTAASKLVFPEGTYYGENGFREWYQQIRKTIKPDNQHFIKGISVVPKNERYEVALQVNMKAETYEGLPLDLWVDEKWQLDIDPQGHIKILEYRVEPLV